MFKKLSALFKALQHDASGFGEPDTTTIHLAMASLLCEVSRADRQEDPAEQAAKQHQLTLLLDISDDDAASLLQQATERAENAVSLYDFTSKLRSLQPNERYLLIEAMWEVAYADGVLDPQEEAIIRQVAELIYVDHAEFIRAKLAAQPQ
uniref:tellurite resistance TerB family protein n=1 Tax=Thaumasiovibrio occultus TaxID=1891184 RepID=UPI000B35B59B|nr:TerB family tellurite resistance protein [Thaumasiovibrio occultus]